LPSSKLALPPPPPSLLAGAALFLDFDGTLVPIVDDPADVAADADLLRVLDALRAGLNGRLAIVSGRSVATLRAMGLGDFVLAGTHGLEFAMPGQQAEAPLRLAAIDSIEAAFNAFAALRPGMLVERKSISVGLHYRGAPRFADDAEALAMTLASEHGLMVQRGKMLFEVRPGGADKGSAVRRLMQRAPFSGGAPVFFGDDVTDEEGFDVAAELGGHGVLVGPQRNTMARFSLEQVAAVRHYLGEEAARLVR
jgi:trehalose 6-phosphate phosphatase